MENKNENSLKTLDKLLMELSALGVSISHKARWGGQFLSKPDLCLIGEYHGGNVGDMALAHSLKSIVENLEHKACLQTLHNLSLWPTYGTIPAIVGGGTVLNSSALTKLVDRFGKNPERLALLGVDYGDISDLHDYQDFLKSVAMLTFRSSKGCKEVGAMLGNDKVSHHFDLAFGLKPVEGNRIKIGEKGKVLGFNILPLYREYERGSFVFGWGGDPLNRETALSESVTYVEVFRSALKHYVEMGYDLVHVPFASEDDAFARFALDGIPITFKPYSRSVTTTQSNFLNFDLFLSTRYHSLIFALIQGVPCVPISYSMKCISLLDDLGVKRFHPTYLPNLNKDCSQALHCITHQEPVSISQDQLALMRGHLEATVVKAISQIFSS